MNMIAGRPTMLRSIPGPHSCELCGKSGLITELIRNPFIYGTGADTVELSADVPVHTCPHCLNSYAGEQAEIARHDAICQHLGVLTPRAIRAIRHSHGLSRAAFARLAGFGETALAQWERRELIQNASIDRTLRQLQDL
ncbi:MAG: hypothetical protein OXI38_01555 [Bacteroidota bacterium]|nr:hypothetical protein [Bacteroidota bacterium]